jgi:hypothetical protein
MLALSEIEPVFYSPAFPFRTALRPTRSHGTEALFPDVQRAIGEIDASSQSGSSTRPPSARLCEWAKHSDERVTIALLGARSLPLSVAALDGISSRAFRVARQEKTILTPVLDALLARYLDGSDLTGDDAMLSGQSARALLRRTRELDAWLRSQQDCVGALPLLGFSSYNVHESIIRHGRHLPLAWIEFSERVHPALILDQARAPSLCPETARQLFTMLLQSATQCRDAGVVGILGALRELRFLHEFSVADCARVEALLGERRTRAEWEETVMGDLLRECLAKSLKGVHRTSRVLSADLTILLGSTDDCIGRAAFDLAGQLVHQPV